MGAAGSLQKKYFHLSEFGVLSKEVNIMFKVSIFLQKSIWRELFFP